MVNKEQLTLFRSTPLFSDTFSITEHKPPNQEIVHTNQRLIFYGYPAYATCTAMFPPNAKLKSMQNSLFIGPSVETADNIVENSLSSKDKLTGQLLTQFLANFTTKIV